jgi:hypothetical protein
MHMNDGSVRDRLPMMREPRTGSTVDLIDRRKNNRYELGAQVSFLWKDSEGNNHQGTGSMRDVSVRGLFVMTLVPPPPIGATVRLDVCFDSSLAESPVAVHARGRVCRIDCANNNRDRWGFAATTKRLIFGSSKALDYSSKTENSSDERQAGGSARR